MKLVLSEIDGWSTWIRIRTQNAEPWRVSDGRWQSQEEIAFIGWSSGDERGHQGTELNPISADELQRFGEMCIEVAKDMRSRR